MNICRALLLVIALQAAAAAQQVSVSGKTEPEWFGPGEDGFAIITLTIDKPFHVNANPASFEYLIPTSVTFEPNAMISVGKPQYPRGEMMAVGGMENPISVYEGRIRIRVPIRVSPRATGEKYLLTGKLEFQPCDDKACFAPDEKSFTVEIQVSQMTVAVDTVSISTPVTTDSVAITFDSFRIPDSPAATSHPTEGKNLIGMIIWVFFGGLALNLTPCVYPLIPITIGYFSRQVPTRRRRFLLAAIYVVSMAVVYAIMGTIAALTGSFFGSFLQSPWVLISLSALMVLFALGMWGAYDIRLPQSLHLLADSKPGPFGAASMGATMGIVAAPCIGPFIVALLTYVGARGNVLEGFVLFLMLGLGLGAPYLFLGAMSESIASLPKAGRVLMGAKRLLGAVLLGLALWFLRPLIGERLFTIGLALLVISTGLLLFFWGYGRRATDAMLEHPRTRLARKTAGVVLVGASLFLFRPEPAQTDAIAWQAYTPELLAASAGKPVMIDVTAAWCIPCRELEHLTFPDPAVIAATENVVTMKVDMTGPTVPEINSRFAKERRVVGVPTIIFIDASGQERLDQRLVGFAPPEDLTARINSIKN